MIISTNGHKAAVGSAEHALMEAAVGPCIAAIAACDTAPESCVVTTDVSAAAPSGLLPREAVKTKC